MVQDINNLKTDF